METMPAEYIIRKMAKVLIAEIEQELKMHALAYEIQKAAENDGE